MNKEKYENAILYFLKTVNNAHLGKVKLMELLYYLDFDHFEKYGTPVTGDTYYHKAAGPLSSQGDAILQEMKEKELIEIQVEYKYISKVAYNPNIFTSSEKEILQEVVEKWKHHSRTEIVEASHDEAPWVATRIDEAIPYALAYYRGKY